MLKKQPAFLLAALLLQLLVSGQNTSYPALRAGFKMGLALSGFTSDVGPFDMDFAPNRNGQYSQYENYFRIAGFAGFTGDYHLSPSFALGAELSLTGRGSAYRVENGSVVIITNQGAEKAYDYYKYKINYLEVPLTARFNLGSREEAGTNFTFYGGLAPAIAVGKKRSFVYYDTNGSSPVANERTRDEALENVSAFNLSPLVGFQLGGNKKAKSPFFVDFRFSYALLPVFNQETDAAGSNLKTRMWTAALGFGIHFR